jgi:hypothetical protein
MPGVKTKKMGRRVRNENGNFIGFYSRRDNPVVRMHATTRASARRTNAVRSGDRRRDSASSVSDCQRDAAGSISDCKRECFGVVVQRDGKRF